MPFCRTPLALTMSAPLGMRFSVSRWRCTLLTLTKLFFVRTETGLRVARESSFTRPDHFAVSSLLLHDDPVVSSVA